MADLDSVREFAARLHADGDGIDVLINNAGIMIPPRSLSPQGHELQFATNHLGHFALTGLLLDLLEAGINPRVVTVTSESHRRGSIHFDDLTGERNYSPVQFYSQSKLANVLFGLELHRRLSAAGSPVRSLIAHPGFASTNLQTNGPTGVLRVGAMIVKWTISQAAEMGALPQLYAAAEANALSGQFIGPGGFREMRGHPTVVRSPG